MVVAELGLPFWIYPAIVWTVIWKAIGMWRAARNNHLGWFLVFLIINTFGLLPIIYLFWTQDKDFNNSSKVSKKKVKKPKRSKKSKIPTLD